MKKFLPAALLVLSFVCHDVTVHAMNDSQDEDNLGLGMVTGSKTGTYIAFGMDIAREAAKAGVKVDVFDSKGSVDNINRIASREKVGLAIVQSDVLGFLSRSKNAESMKIAQKIRLVAPFYDEEVHILANKNIKDIQDLAGKRVVVGGDASGSVITAENIFSILGITPAKLFETDPPHGVIALLNNEVDAFVFVGGKPVKMFKNMEELEKITQGPNAGKLQNVRFLPINDQRLFKEYKPAVITHNDYGYVGEDTPTIAVTAVLVTYDYTMKDTPYYRERCQNMQKLVKSLYDNMDDLRANGHPKWHEVNLGAEMNNWKRDVCSQRALSENAAPKNESSFLEKDLIGIVRNR